VNPVRVHWLLLLVTSSWVLGNLHVIQLLAGLDQLAAVAAPRCAACTASTTLETILLLHICAVDALKNPSPVSSECESAPSCAPSVHGGVAYIVSVYGAMVVFAEDDAGAESGLEAEVEGCAAGEKRGLVWTRHVESGFGGAGCLACCQEGAREGRIK